MSTSERRSPNAALFTRMSRCPNLSKNSRYVRLTSSSLLTSAVIGWTPRAFAASFNFFWLRPVIATREPASASALRDGAADSARSSGNERCCIPEIHFDVNPSLRNAMSGGYVFSGASKCGTWPSPGMRMQPAVAVGNRVGDELHARLEDARRTGQAVFGAAEHERRRLDVRPVVDDRDRDTSSARAAPAPSRTAASRRSASMHSESSDTCRTPVSTPMDCARST